MECTYAYVELIIKHDCDVKLDKDRSEKVTVYEWMIKRCPYCKKSHFHSAGIEEKETITYLGYKATRCDEIDSIGYCITNDVTLNGIYHKHYHK